MVLVATGNIDKSLVPYALTFSPDEEKSLSFETCWAKKYGCHDQVLVSP